MRVSAFLSPVAVVVLTTACFAQTSTPSSSTDGLEILKRVAQHYADAKSYHIEADSLPQGPILQNGNSEPLLKALAGLGPEYASLAPKSKIQPCGTEVSSK